LTRVARCRDADQHVTDGPLHRLGVLQGNAGRPHRTMASLGSNPTLALHLPDGPRGLAGVTWTHSRGHGRHGTRSAQQGLCEPHSSARTYARWFESLGGTFETAQQKALQCDGRHEAHPPSVPPKRPPRGRQPAAERSRLSRGLWARRGVGPVGRIGCNGGKGRRPRSCGARAPTCPSMSL
jgi:hypothetical protein